MEYLFVLAGTLSALFFIIMILNKGKRTDHWFLALLFFLIIVSCYYVFQLYHSQGAYYVPYFSEVNYSIPLLYGPLLWFYTRSLITKNFKLEWIEAIHLIPFIGFLLFLVIHLISDSDSGASSELGYPLIKLIINPIYIFLTLRLLEDHRKILFEQYAHIDQMHHYWLTWITYGGLLLWIVACLGNIFNWYNGYDTSILGDYFLIGFLAILMFILAFIGFNRTEIFQAAVQEPILPSIDPGFSIASLKEQDENKLVFDRLQEVMKTEAPFLDPTLSLHKLAAVSHISAGKLSIVINQVAGQNFYDFVNSYRVTAVQVRLQTTDVEQYSMLGIAEECGFNSKASFNRIFKKTTGMTPTEFIRKSKIG